MPKQQNLEYDAQVPAFLQRLKAGNAALGGRHNVQIPRARGGAVARLKMEGEDGEDDPVVLDEFGREMAKEDVKALTAEQSKQESAVGPAGVTAQSQEPEDSAGEKKVTTGGFSRKRKSAKVIGTEDGYVAEETDKGKAPVKSIQESTDQLAEVIGERKQKAAEKNDGKKAKRKKVKLSFDEPE